MPNFSQTAAPLFSLLKKKPSPFKWEAAHEVAFRALIDAMSAETTLANIEPGTLGDNKLVLRTDASELGIGGVILLRSPGKPDRPVAYISKSLTKAQKRWTTLELELFAILYCLTHKQYSPLFKIAPFVIETDHRNLIFLANAAESNDRLRRWKMILLGYVFEYIAKLL